MSKALLTGVLVTFFALSGTVSGASPADNQVAKGQVVCASRPYAATGADGIEQASKALNNKIGLMTLAGLVIKQMSAPSANTLFDGHLYSATVCVSIISN
jgi:hypothetical protein